MKPENNNTIRDYYPSFDNREKIHYTEEELEKYAKIMSFKSLMKSMLIWNNDAYINKDRAKEFLTKFNPPLDPYYLPGRGNRIEGTNLVHDDVIAAAKLYPVNFIDKLKAKKYGTKTLGIPEAAIYATSAWLMNRGREFALNDWDPETTWMNQYRRNRFIGNYERDDNAAEHAVLLPKFLQDRYFSHHGYTKDNASASRQLFKKALGNRKVNIYKTHEDAVDRKDVEVVGNSHGMYVRRLDGFDLKMPPHANKFSGVLYKSKDGKYFYKFADLNDYGNRFKPAGDGQFTYGWKQPFAELVDVIGNPVIIETGIQPITDIAAIQMYKAYPDDSVKVHLEKRFPWLKEKIKNGK